MTDTNATESRVQKNTRTSRRWAWVMGFFVPAAMSVTAVLLMASWVPELPDPIAIHWGAHGVDGYGHAVPTILMPLGIVVGFSVFAVAASWKLTPAGRLSSSQKFMLVTGVWLSALLSVGVGGSVYMQRGLSDASLAGAVEPWLAAGAIIGLVLATGCWFLMPKADSSLAPGVAAEPVAIASTERVAWSQTVVLNGLVIGAITVVVALGTAVAIFALVEPGPGSWFAVATLAVAVLLGVATSSWRVTADHRGLTVRSIIGVPRFRVPLADIADVRVVEVNPAADFGGWGYRWAGGRTGVIMRAGAAIEVVRRNGKRFVVTVDDAPTGASVLAAQRTVS